MIGCGCFSYLEREGSRKLLLMSAPLRLDKEQWTWTSELQKGLPSFSGS